MPLDDARCARAGVRFPTSREAKPAIGEPRRPTASTVSRLSNPDVHKRQQFRISPTQTSKSDGRYESRGRRLRGAHFPNIELQIPLVWPPNMQGSTRLPRSLELSDAKLRSARDLHPRCGESTKKRCDHRSRNSAFRGTICTYVDVHIALCNTSVILRKGGFFSS